MINYSLLTISKVMTIKDCIDNVIEQLEEHAERNNIEVA